MHFKEGACWRKRKQRGPVYMYKTSFFQVFSFSCKMQVPLPHCATSQHLTFPEKTSCFHWFLECAWWKVVFVKEKLGWLPRRGRKENTYDQTSSPSTVSYPFILSPASKEESQKRNQEMMSHVGCRDAKSKKCQGLGQKKGQPLKKVPSDPNPAIF